MPAPGGRGAAGAHGVGRGLGCQVLPAGWGRHPASPPGSPEGQTATRGDGDVGRPCARGRAPQATTGFPPTSSSTVTTDPPTPASPANPEPRGPRISPPTSPRTPSPRRALGVRPLQPRAPELAAGGRVQEDPAAPEGRQAAIEHHVQPLAPLPELPPGERTLRVVPGGPGARPSSLQSIKAPAPSAGTSGLGS